MVLGGASIAKDFPSPELDNIMNKHCHGCVLDIGPGAGFQLQRFKGAFSSGQIQRIYGVEPSVEMHNQLRVEAVKVFGERSDSIYRVITSGAQPSQLVPALYHQKLLTLEILLRPNLTPSSVFELFAEYLSRMRQHRFYITC